MGAHLARAGGGGSSRRRRGRSRGGPIADINMTPFIDVMLVLLIIFMIAAPLLATGVPVELPQTTAAPINVDRKPITVTIDEGGRVFVNDRSEPVGDLVGALRELAKAGPEERIYVRGHKRVGYGRVAEVMSTITGAGFKRVALVTEPGETK